MAALPHQLSAATLTDLEIISFYPHFSKNKKANTILDCPVELYTNICGLFTVIVFKGNIFQTGLKFHKGNEKKMGLSSDIKIWSAATSRLISVTVTTVRGVFV